MAPYSSTRRWLMLVQIFVLFFLICVVSDTLGADNQEKAKPKKKKDIRDYNDADMERLFQQWEEDEEKDPDDLMEHEKPKPKLDFSKIDPKNPESVLQMSKKGQTLMMFVAISGNPTKEETEKLTQLWQDQLFNANFQLQRYIVDDDRALFMVTDGSKAWEIKNFLIDQDRCKDVTIEGQVYNGRGSGKPMDSKPRPAGMDDEDDKGKHKKKGGKKSKSNDLKKKPPGSKDKEEAARIKENKAGSKKGASLDPKDNMVLLSEEEAELLQQGKKEEL